MDHKEEQKNICAKYNAPFVESPSFLKVGIAKNIKDLLQPINGLDILLKEILPVGIFGQERNSLPILIFLFRYILNIYLIFVPK